VLEDVAEGGIGTAVILSGGWAEAGPEGMARQRTLAAHLGLRLGWPSGEWGSLPIEGGVETAYRRLIAEAPDPERARIEIEARLKLMKSVFPVAEAFGVEDLIDPRDTRPLLIRYLEAVSRGWATTWAPSLATESGLESQER
jgi:acetyl-CoA carboxylase carboxyltransferase component